MTKQEWDKCFAWLLAMFPKWDAAADTSAAWYGEIGDMEVSGFMPSVRSLMAKNPSPFPPGVFEIKNEAYPYVSLHPGPGEAWGIALSGATESRSIVWTDEIAEAQGACQEQLWIGDKVGARMAFLEKYRILVSEAEREGRPPKWRPSLGFGPSGREEAQNKAAELNQQVMQRLGAPERRLLT